MRTYGRIGKTWVKVETDANGYDDDVFVTALCQVLLLNLNESPFYASWGLPAKPTIVSQVQPDFYVALTQQRFAPRFASLSVAKTNTDPPTYRINVTKHSGAKVSLSLETPQ